jgi:dipeptidyl aminopeptidase/acylaminoacyl peptidase
MRLVRIAKMTRVPDNWQAADTAGQVERLAGALMIVMGERDENVLPGSTLHVVDALQRANKDFDLIYLPSTDHFFRTNCYVNRRILDFFARHLAGPAQRE